MCLIREIQKVNVNTCTSGKLSNSVCHHWEIVISETNFRVIPSDNGTEKMMNYSINK